jgi:hypothetical protein
MAKIGRPTLFTPELGDRICAEVMAGNPLVRICAADDMPHPATVYRWFRENKSFCDNYARAKEDQADYFVEDILQIADIATPEDIQVARLRVDTRKWAASKYKPKKYGDKITQEQTGPDGGPIENKVTVEIVKTIHKDT